MTIELDLFNFQVNIGDRFGEVMLKNLRARGCPLAGADACQSLSSQENRFASQLLVLSLRCS